LKLPDWPPVLISVQLPPPELELLEEDELELLEPPDELDVLLLADELEEDELELLELDDELEELELLDELEDELELDDELELLLELEELEEELELEDDELLLEDELLELDEEPPPQPVTRTPAQSA
jgi:hypothetical protein